MLQDRILDKKVPIPLYFQLKNLIIEEISQGSYPIDSMIPTENELGDLFKISRTTVRQAIGELVQEGRLYRQKSKGTFVAKPKVNQEILNPSISFDDEILKSGRVPTTEILSMEVGPTSDRFAAMCNVEKNAKTVCLYRKIYADKEPILRIKTYLPYDKCHFVMTYNFAQDKLYEVLATNENTRICRVVKTCEAVSAAHEDVDVLSVKKGSPIHFFTTYGYNVQNELIEYSLAYYRGDQSRFHMEIVIDQDL